MFPLTGPYLVWGGQIAFHEKDLVNAVLIAPFLTAGERNMPADVKEPLGPTCCFCAIPRIWSRP